MNNRKEYCKKYYLKNKTKILSYVKKYQEEHKEEVKLKVKLYAQNHKQELKEYNKKYSKLYYILNKIEIKERTKIYKLEHRKEFNKHIIQKRKTDINFKLRGNLTIRIWQALKGINKSERTIKLLGCTIEFLKKHLEKQFTEGMSWSNYGRGWHVDHIRPCSSFDLSKKSEQLKCFNYKNLQPLWAIDNLEKSNKYELIIGE